MKKKVLLLSFLLFFYQNIAFSIEDTSDIIQFNEQKNELSFENYVSNSEYLTGDLYKFRSNLEENGINFQSNYMTNSFIMRKGEMNKKKGTYQGLLNVSVELDTEKMNLYKGGKIFALYQLGNKGLGSPEYFNSYSYINSYDPIENINQLSELYYEHSFYNDRFNIKIGKQDANIDFQALENGFKFLNLSFSYIPNTPMPLFPCQQTGARARLKLSDNWYFQGGFYDGGLEIGANPKGFFNGKNGYFNIVETYYLTNVKGKKGKYMLGSWLKTKDSENFNNNYGFYGGFEQKLFSKKDNQDGGLSTFAQFGYANDNINSVPYYGGVGFVYRGIGKTRINDEAGVGFAWHQFSHSLKTLNNQTSEKVIECFYKIQLTKFLYLQPDFQYIIRPNGNMKNSVAVGLRTCVTF